MSAPLTFVVWCLNKMSRRIRSEKGWVVALIRRAIFREKTLAGQVIRRAPKKWKLGKLLKFDSLI